MTTNNSDGRRVRTVTWQDPQVSARDAASISGFEYMRQILAGKISPPPVAMLIGYRPVVVEEGRTVFEFEPGEHLYNPFASVHGGIMTTVIDSAMTSAVLTMLPAGVGCSTLEMKVNFVRPITSRTGCVQAEGKVIHIGSRIAIAEGRLKDPQDKLYAYAVNTCMLFHVEQSK